LECERIRASSGIDLSDAVGFMPRPMTAVSLGLDPDALNGLQKRTGAVVAGPLPGAATPEV